MPLNVREGERKRGGGEREEGRCCGKNIFPVKVIESLEGERERGRERKRDTDYYFTLHNLVLTLEWREERSRDLTNLLQAIPLGSNPYKLVLYLKS